MCGNTTQQRPRAPSPAKLSECGGAATPGSSFSHACQSERTLWAGPGDTAADEAIADAASGASVQTRDCSKGTDDVVTGLDDTSTDSEGRYQVSSWSSEGQTQGLVWPERASPSVGEEQLLVRPEGNLSVCGRGGGEEGIPLGAQRAHILLMLMLAGPLATQAGDGAGASEPVQRRWES